MNIITEIKDSQALSFEHSKTALDFFLTLKCKNIEYALFFQQ